MTVRFVGICGMKPGMNRPSDFYRGVGNELAPHWSTSLIVPLAALTNPARKFLNVSNYCTLVR
jgi:hypothetical protein